MTDPTDLNEISAGPVQLNAGRVTGAAMAGAMTSAGASALAPLPLGCLAVLVRAMGESACAGGPSAFERVEVQGVLMGRGIGADDSAIVLASLRQAGLIEIADDVVRIPVLEAAATSERAALLNRRAGWKKRGARLAGEEAPEQKSPAAPPATDTPHATPPSGTGDLGLGGDAGMSEVGVGPKLKRPKPASAVREEGGIRIRRFCATDKVQLSEDADPVAIRFQCKGENVAEVTQGFLKHLQETFKGIDVEEQLRLSALWCESNPSQRKTFDGFRRFLASWLGRAVESHRMRGDLIRSSGVRNGFGQGGHYVAETPGPADAQPQGALNLDDDFSDLSSASLVTTPEAVKPAQAPAPAVNPASVARAALASRVARRSFAAAR